MLWASVLGCSVGCYLLKLLGLSVPERVLDRPVVRRVAGLVPVALLAALVAVQTLAAGDRAGQHVVLDARLAGLAVAVAALMARLPFLAVVVLAGTTAALVRLL